nr:vegetative incompatibility protein het-e-1 [Quercus suber]
MTLTKASQGNLLHDWEDDFRASSWFTRGWTLQELLAPKSVDFFSRDGQWLGSKRSFEHHIRDVTGIPVKALRENTLTTFTTQERFSWQDRRITTKDEDTYYSPLGIMDVSMPVIYGEGRENARRRLEREILYVSKGSQPDNFSVAFSLVKVVEISNFVARHGELDEMRKALTSDGSRRCIVLHGLGGIGKTYLSTAYAVRYRDKYSAVFWLNIKDDDSVRSGFVRVARQILRDHPSATKFSALDLTTDVDAVVDAVKAWPNLPGNTRWLLVFDNCDRPKLPGSTDWETVDNGSYMPEAYQGSVIVTTRSTEVDIGRRLPIKKLDDLRDSLTILANSSQRENFLQDSDAERLARKLDGLPLALVTAGAYLHQTPGISCSDYLRF